MATLVVCLAANPTAFGQANATVGGTVSDATGALDESREFEMRVDAINILNHSNWGNPTLDINSTNFGRITTKTATAPLH